MEGIGRCLFSDSTKDVAVPSLAAEVGRSRISVSTSDLASAATKEAPAFFDGLLISPGSL